MYCYFRICGLNKESTGERTASRGAIFLSATSSEKFIANVKGKREQRAESREQRTVSREQRTENREQRTENREQRTENREQRTED
jgi:hypothetical protein